MYQIFYRRSAQKALLKMPRTLAARFQDAFRRLAEDPTRRDLDVKALAGREGYRLRIGEWRALYSIHQGRLLILVLDIGPRGDIYQ